MDYHAVRNLPALLFAQAERLGDRPFLWRRDGGRYLALSYRETAERVGRAARGLIALGLRPGERVALVAENRPEWLIADLAIMAAGGITVPTFTTNTTADHRHILTHSGASGVILSSRAIAARLLPAALDASDLRFLVSIEDLEPAQRPPFAVVGWQALLEKGAAQPDDIAARIAALKRDEVCCFVYTSGTGGVPKGVMLTHGSIICNCMGAHELLRGIGLGDDIFLSFLPLSHSYEHTAGQFFPLSVGAQIYYAESVEKLLDNLAEVRPTIMTAVPRLYEVMHQRILNAVGKAKPLRRQLFRLACDLGRQKYERPGSLTPLQRLLDLVAEVAVRRQVQRRFGGRLKALVSGGAALNYEIGLFFTALGVRILQGYGQTEASPVVSANLPRRPKLHTVGPPLKEVEVKIAEDGEILVRGELVMKGYWRDEAATAATLRDGWLHTGDIGIVDADGYLQITDRKKDIIVLSGGDNVSPARIEGFLILQPEIQQAMVYGDRRPHLVALLVPDPDFVMGWARDHGRPADLAALAADSGFAKALAPAVERFNAGASSVERVRRFMVATEPFTIENGMMTATLKIRRHTIRRAYGAALDRLYESRAA